MNLPKNGKMINGVIFASEAIVPYQMRNLKKDLLPTPTASQYGTTNNGQRSDGTTFNQAGKPSLETMAKMGLIELPTPTASDSTNTRDSRKRFNREGTPDYNEKKANNPVCQNLHTAVTHFLLPQKLLPTPTTIDDRRAYHFKPGTKEKIYSLGGLAQIGMLSLPTPTTMDSGPPLPPRKKNPSGGQAPPLNSVIGGRLCPRLVEYMMGLPQDYTKSLEELELNNLETALSAL